jgi:isopentenyl-diphosphate delta-isomerase
MSQDDLLFASGGLKDGLDIAKRIALSASLGRMAENCLKAVAVSTEKTVEMMKLTKRQIEAAKLMVCAAKLVQQTRPRKRSFRCASKMSSRR